MSVALRTPAGSKSIVEIAARDAGNVVQTIQEGWIRTTAGLKQLFGQFVVSLSRSSVIARTNSGAAVPITSPSVTCNVEGGSEPFTYAWTKTAGVAGWTIGSPAAATTNFTSPALGPGESEAATFICTVTDAAGHILASSPVTVTASNIYGGFA